MAPKFPDSVEKLRAAGNESFRNGQYAEASALYGRALRVLQAQGSSDPEEEGVLYSNRAACHLKDGNCRDCIKDCTSMTRALMDSLGPEWRLKLPSIPLVPVSAQKRWNSLPLENHKEKAKSKSKETTATKNRVPSAGDVEKARVLKEEGNELVKKGNHKKAIEKYSESLLCSNLESATYSNRALCYLVLKQYTEAVKDCTEALKLDGKNVKAFYRRAQAHKALKDYKSSFADISNLLQIEPRNGPAQKLWQEVKQNLH
ncbi:mitochondrial import receptor subunit TOM34 isoform X4 [Trachypithecus francoisi]|uniref:mitochondrial import receptor subunit TOM34 isoform X4 n=1 Tax=Trachypithecus francoisi TaxID=54180 RepID=UPI00141BE75E|nr:mitochondrial import receptor subunit TOM34 isoform X4 [Trachypithecus francoisi]